MAETSGKASALSRAAELASFLASTDWKDATRTGLTGDASTRRYERLLGGPSPALLVDAPPPEDTKTFIRMAGWLITQGLVAPRILAAQEELGFLVVQDFGDSLLHACCNSDPMQEIPLYLKACKELLVLQQAELPFFLPRYDEAFFLSEIAIFVQWAGKALSQNMRDDFLQRWREVLPLALGSADVVVHRDFHALNLLATDGRLAIIDFQGARTGPAAYDLASLLVDARRDVSPVTTDQVLQHYLAARPFIDADDFKRAFAIMTAQRSIKILGLFRRLARRDGKVAYLNLLPRVRIQLSQALEHPALAPIRDWHSQYGFGS